MEGRGPEDSSHRRGPIAGQRGGPGLRVRRLRRVHLPRGRAHYLGSGVWRPHHLADPGSHAPLGRQRAARCRRRLHPLCVRRPVAAGAVDASRLRCGAAGGSAVYDARGYLRRPHRRLVDVHHLVYDLRGVPRSVRRRKVLRGPGLCPYRAAAHRRRAGGHRRVIPPRWPIGQWGGHHRHRGGHRLSAAAESRIRP